MKWSQLLTELNARSIGLSADDGELIVRAPEGVISPELWEHIARHKSALLQLLQTELKNGQSPKWPRITPQSSQRFEPFPLTPIQEAYWLGRNPAFELGRVGIHIYEELDCRNLDIFRLNQAWQGILNRHEMLRAVVLPDGRQQILPDAAYSIGIRDLRSTRAEEKTAVLDSIRRELVQRVYDPRQWPLFTIVACRLNDEETRLFISIDAIHADMGSLAILFSDWSDLYEHPDKQLPPLSLSYRDYALAVSALRRHENFREAQAYWHRQAAGMPPPPNLPYLCQFNALGTQTFDRRSGRLNQSIWQKLKQKAARAGITPSGITLSAFAEVLTRWGQKQKFTLNVTLFNRLPVHPEVNEIVGDFTSMIPLPISPEDGASFFERAVCRQQRIWDGLDHRIVSGVEVLRELRRSQQQPLMGQLTLPVVFTSTLNLKKQGVLPLKKFGKRVFNRIQTPQVSLDLQVYEEDGHLIYSWDAVSELFPPGMLEQMFTVYGQLLEKLAGETDLWTDSDQELVTVPVSAGQLALNETCQPVPARTLSDLFAEQVKQSPDRPAVISPELTLTYKQLYRIANRIGRWLRQEGCSPGNLVAVIMDKGWEQIAAVWGIIQAGGAYLPLDPTEPSGRLAALLAEAGVELILSQPRLAGELNLPGNMQIRSVSADVCADFAETPLVSITEPSDLAYLLYTSGSTGSPKGVMIEQQSIVNRMMDVIDRFSIKPDDKILALTALHHDLAVFDIFGTVLAGATVIMPDPAKHNDPVGWANLILRQGVTVWNSVPAYLGMLMEYLLDAPPLHRHLSSLRLVLLSGDWIPLNLPEQVRSVNPDTQVVSLGGPTETTVWDICYPITEINPSWRSIPYGRPMNNALYYILNDNLEPCPEWVVGEICIGGAGLARGYWRDDRRTREKFFFHQKTGQRLYRSGDLGRYIPEGYIEIIGRKDIQLKVNGWRIEPGEIEETLKQFPGINQAVVLPLQKSGRNTGLVAYLVRSRPDTGWKPAESDLSRTKLSQCEQALFTLERKGLRTDLQNLPSINLELSGADSARSDRFYRRRSVRSFSEKEVSRFQIDELLGCLSGYQSPGALTPKFLYPSAGNLQPVQCYLHIADGRVEDLAAGIYYYHPERHCLISLSNSGIPVSCHLPHNAKTCEQAAFSIFLIGQMTAIEPVYGELARDFCLLEAGSITQLLMSEAPACGLGLCPVGDLDFQAVRPLFRLDETHSFLHCIVGGNPVDKANTEQSRTSNGNRFRTADNGVPTGTDADWLADLKKFLAGKLPAHLIPKNFVVLESLPLNSNGKIDRQALTKINPEQLSPFENTTAAKAVRNRIESRLVEIWREVLETDEISLEANFGEMGADSIHLVQVLHRLGPSADRELSVTDLFRYPNIRALAEFLGTKPEDEQTLREGKRRAALRSELGGRRKG